MLVCIREAGSDKTAMYYDLKELEEKFKILARKVMTEKGFMKKIEKRFNAHWKKVKPYTMGNKKLKNIKELKDYINNLIELWITTIVYWVIPRIPQLPEEIRKNSEEKRQKIEHISDIRSVVIVEFIKEKYPEYKEIANMMLPEEMYLLEKRKLNNKELKEIKKRQKGECMINGKELPIENLEKELLKRNLKIPKEKVSNVKELKGQIACKGKVKGKVRLILYKEQIKDIKDREILVTEMTTPDYVPAMKKAAAIITNEGGVTCHAAIASRELRKPCIIGTKIATKIFKNGMLVEVDADKGIIKILEKK